MDEAIVERILANKDSEPWGPIFHEFAVLFGAISE
jgi:hypothetical protein